MKLNSAQLEAFSAVAKALNFTRAAESLAVTQSALSQRVAKLENDLEATLFIRDRSSVRLTEAGEQVLRFCLTNEAIESSLLEKLRASKTELAGSLRIGGFSSVNRSLVIPALRPLMQIHSRLSINLITKEVHDLPRLLQNGEVDYVLSNQKWDSLDVHNTFLGFEEYVLVRSKKPPIQEIFLDHNEKDPTTKEYHRHFKSKNVAVNMRYLGDIYGLIDGVRNGYGKAILPLHLIAGEKNLQVLYPQQILKTPVYLQFFVQPYYRQIHAAFLHAIDKLFKGTLRQE